ncbi:hypothetical protein [Comamonas sp.]|uniref:hypothetical protein n=1 Tax=Comamonas sp. TaxID=34028 RepID=UPI0026474633|nr:hypothetical protein [Comamonas sp.]
MHVVDMFPDALRHGVGSRLLVLLVACGRAFGQQVSAEVVARSSFQFVRVLRNLRFRAKALNFKAHLAHLLLGGRVFAWVVVGDEVCEVITQLVDALQRGALHD